MAKLTRKSNRLLAVSRLSQKTGRSQAKATHPVKVGQIDVDEQIRRAWLCCDQLAPLGVSHIIRGFYKDSLAYDIRERVSVIYKELKRKTRMTKQTWGLILELMNYVQHYIDNLFVVTPVIISLISLCYENQHIKSDIFSILFDLVWEAVKKHPNQLGLHFQEFLFATFDVYKDPDAEHLVADWNNRCVERILDVGASDLILQGATDILHRPTSNYTQKDAFRICWVVTKMCSVYLQSHQTSTFAESLTPRFEEASVVIASKMEQLND
jgi:hypothetical protein